MEFGRLDHVDIRTIWPNEAKDFTPWLLDNPETLAEALGIELEIKEAEHPVGNFSLDLVGRDLTHDTVLIVENQLEDADHKHLGQLLTYAAGTDAGTIVWIAPSIRQEYRQALDWLNQLTPTDVRFFGVTVRAVRIGDSPPAPLLELVATPNDWQKQVRAMTGATRRTWTPYEVFNALGEACSEDVVNEIRRLVDRVNQVGGRLRGRSGTHPTLSFELPPSSELPTPRSLATVYVDPSGPKTLRMTINFGSLAHDLGDDQLMQILVVLERSEVLRRHMIPVRRNGFNTYPAIPLSEIGGNGITHTLLDAIAPFLPVEH